MKNILMYSHDTYGLGNIRRTIAIANHLVARFEDINVLIVTGSPVIQRFYLQARVDYVKLPCLARTDRNCYRSKFLELRENKVQTLRANMIRSAIRDLEPELILVDKNPNGINNELVALFEDLRALAARPKLVLLLRDILDAGPETRALWQREGYDDVVCREYDQVLVVGEREIFDLGEMYRFSEKLSSMLNYCGYIERRHASHTHDLNEGGARSEQQRVLVMAGGGQDGYFLLKNYLIARRRHFRSSAHASLLCCGPELSSEQYAEIQALGDYCPDTTIERFSSCLEEHIRDADVVVCMGGYNTVCEAMSYRKKTIVVPRAHPVKEQAIRAEKFQQLGLLRMICTEQLEPENLASTLCAVLADARDFECTPEKLSLDGLRNVSIALGRILETPSMTHAAHGAIGSVQLVAQPA